MATYRFLTADGTIDSVKVGTAVQRKADELSRWRGTPIGDCLAEAEALYRNIAVTEQSDWRQERADKIRVAACAFVRGALEGLTPEQPIVFHDAPGLDAGSYERNSRFNAEAYRQRREALDATLARITASTDIVQFLQAAE